VVVVVVSVVSTIGVISVVAVVTLLGFHEVLNMVCMDPMVTEFSAGDIWLLAGLMFS